MSTGGNVPTQGVTVQEATTAKKRGDRSMGHPNGYVGKGTAGSRLKSAHRKWKKGHKSLVVAAPAATSLREFARSMAEGKLPLSGIAAKEELQADAKSWLEGKGLS